MQAGTAKELKLASLSHKPRKLGTNCQVTRVLTSQRSYHRLTKRRRISTFQVSPQSKLQLNLRQLHLGLKHSIKQRPTRKQRSMMKAKMIILLSRSQLSPNRNPRIQGQAHRLTSMVLNPKPQVTTCQDFSSRINRQTQASTQLRANSSLLLKDHKSPLSKI